jgi:hypothetical protein
LFIIIPIAGTAGGYEFVVAENAAQGTLLGHIRAIDPDSGSFGQISYSLHGFGAEKFNVDPVSGEITVAACGDALANEIVSSGVATAITTCLDYETQASYVLTYTATDGGGQMATTGLTIRLEDVNDNHPVFEQAGSYRRVVREGDSGAFEPPLIIRASDKESETVFYTIRSINTDATVFVIDPMTGELTMTKPVRVEDTENGRYDLVIRATDQGRPEPLYADTEVFVSVGRTRNQRPHFAQARYEVTMAENAAVGERVLQVVAEDPDGRNADLRYSIHDGSKDNFVIDAVSGAISVAAGAVLDIQQNGDHYELEVRAVDNGEPHPQTGSTMVVVTIRDMNDKPPAFAQAAYTEYVVENEPAGHEVLTVVATDPDRNAELEYDIVEPITARDKSGTVLESSAGGGDDYDFKSAFSIDPATGRITINEKLSYNLAAVIILTLQVRDRKAEVNTEAQVATAEATFYIQAFNADSPVFPAPWTPSDPRIRINVTEELPPGTPLFNLGARDPLTGQAITAYQKLAPPAGAATAGDDVIQVSQYGDVISSARLDFEAVKTISFSVAAMAGGSGSEERTSEAHITLQLIDANDNAPEFEVPPGGYTAEIPEDILPLGLVTTVKAVDKDSGELGEVAYTLEGEGATEFMIHESEGHIQV